MGQAAHDRGIGGRGVGDVDSRSRVMRLNKSRHLAPQQTALLFDHLVGAREQ